MMGVKPGDRVILIMDTRLEWQLVAHAVNRLGAAVGTLYSTLGPEGIKHGINELEVKLVVASSSLVNMLLAIIGDTPTVTDILLVDRWQQEPANVLDQKRVTVTSLDAIESSGAASGGQLDYVNKPEDVAFILYTSGSSGVPKGVVLQQKQLVYGFRYMEPFFAQFKYSPRDSMLAYLPQAHIFELMQELTCIAYGIQIGYGSPFTMATGGPGLGAGCPGDLVVLKPTAFAMVPLLLDRIKNAMLKKVEHQGDFMVKLFNWCVDYKAWWRERGWKCPIVDALVFRKPREALGGQLKQLIVGAAPLSSETQRFMRTVLDVDLQVGYGASETVAVGTVCQPTNMTLGRVGGPHSGVHVKVVAWEEGGYTPYDQPRPRGEMWIGGGHICSGYYKRPEETRAAIVEESDDFRWWASGDIVELHPDGTFTVIDRKKDLVKLQNGEYVSLGKIESVLVTCPFVENICVVGDSAHNFLVALVAPNKLQLMRTSNNNNNLQEICRDPDVITAIHKSLAVVGKKAGLGRVEIPAKIHVCDLEWTPASGLVTATLKVRRKQLMDYYKSEIADMYKLN